MAKAAFIKSNNNNNNNNNNNTLGLKFKEETSAIFGA